MRTRTGRPSIPERELVYKTNPPKSAPFVPKGAASTHMFGPEWLLDELKRKERGLRVHFSPMRTRRRR
jgi:hypothetical protein